MENRHCLWCGALLIRKEGERPHHFARRKNCNAKCAGLSASAKTPIPKSVSTYWSRARREVPPGPCEECGAPNARDVHHRDHNHTNNARENLQRTCRSCHIRHHRKAIYCAQCGQRAKARGLCVKHYGRFMAHGDPRAVLRGASPGKPGTLFFEE